MSQPNVPRISLDIVIGFSLSMIVGVLASALLSLLVLLVPGTAHADDADLVRISEVTRGSILLRSDQNGLFRQAPHLHTDVNFVVSGMVVRAKVVQRFRNPTQEWLEGVYVFPLPEDAAVDHMRMKIGERTIEGIIREREEAKKIYQKAKKEGKKSALLEQNRPNIFTNSVANIGPGETISVEIEYQQVLQYDAGEFRLRFPMVVAPRYIPGMPVESTEVVTGFSGTGWAKNTDQVPDASRITPPVVAQGHEKINPVTLRVDLDAGFPLAKLQSSYHAIHTRDTGDGKILIELANESVPADRDFELVWAPQKGQAPRAALFTERASNDQYLMLMLLPPDAEAVRNTTPHREVIFVIDTSGSMGGMSITQAKQALQLAIRRLRPGDRFNVIQFNSNTDMLFPAAVNVTPENIRRAQAYVDRLEANGGTEMAGAMQAALSEPESSGLVRQVIFLTDGSIGNENALFGIIQSRLKDQRLFTVGIGSAPNSHFMTKAAQYGRGTYTYIGDVGEVQEKMITLFTKLESPALTNIQVQFPGDVHSEAWPARIPDLYAGEPIVLTAKVSDLKGQLVISGTREKQEWKVTLPLENGRSSPGVGILWARKKIADLMDRIRTGDETGALRTEVTDIALQHHLISKYTSLVAVDVTPSRPQDESLKTRANPTNLPAGWVHGKVFGALPATAAGSDRDLLIGMMLIMLAVLFWILRMKESRYEDLA